MHTINTKVLAIHKERKKSWSEDLWLQFAQILDCLCKVNKVLVDWDFWMTKVSMFIFDTCEFACGFEETCVPLKSKIILRQGDFLIWEIEVVFFIPWRAWNLLSPNASKAHLPYLYTYDQNTLNHEILMLHSSL